MKTTTTWTALSLLTLTTAAGASLLFAACTVTSGKINDDGGIGNPRTDSSIPDTDSSIPDTDSGSDGSTGGTCESNTKQTAPLVNQACQKALEEKCCAELTGCFGLVPDQDAAAGGSDDCNKYAACIATCNDEPDAGAQQTCYDDCNAASQKAIQDAYDTLIKCATQKASDVCQ